MFNVLTLLIATLSLLIALFRTGSANKIAKFASDTAKASLYLSVRSAIKDAFSEYMNQGRHLAEIKGRHERKCVTPDEIKEATGSARAACEMWIQAYEDACSFCIKSQIDADLFRQEFAKEICNLCRDTAEPVCGILRRNDKTDFGNIWALYPEYCE